MNAVEFLEKISYLNGYLMGVSELCHGLNYVPRHEIISCLVLSNNVFADIQKRISLTPATLDACKECSNFEIVDDWEEHLKRALDKWIFNLIYSKNLLNEDAYLNLKSSAEHRLIYLLIDILVGDELQVWKFQIGKGCCYTYGFDNEAYAFKSENKLLIVTFGWAD
jgi:hypothetical protein